MSKEGVHEGKGGYIKPPFALLFGSYAHKKLRGRTTELMRE